MKKFITLQDPDGSLKSELESYHAIYIKDHPDVHVSLSSIVRMAIREGLVVLRERAKPRLESKQTTGILRK